MIMKHVQTQISITPVKPKLLGHQAITQQLNLPTQLLDLCLPPLI
ncbi:hypothetical protein Prudu_019537 [Prunus dulcis]|uniref:Uncharacterized protein n=1 Tax=Prunus dulcis TaxID=3755 RepID=A0A4Y1RUX8_PRUDU|nr:hypothetical protein Prudu_019537 [Prunus dulcis]